MCEIHSAWDKQQRNQTKQRARIITIYFLRFSLSHFLCICYSILENGSYKCQAHTSNKITSTTPKNYEVYQCLLFLCALFIISRLIPLYVFGMVTILCVFFFKTLFHSLRSIVAIFFSYADIVDHDFYFSSCHFHTYTIQSCQQCMRENERNRVRATKVEMNKVIDRSCIYICESRKRNDEHTKNKKWLAKTTTTVLALPE